VRLPWLTTRMPAGIACLIALGLLITASYAERASLERGNRLHRSGQEDAAVRVYEQIASSEGAPGVATYNLGTGLLGLGGPGAESALRAAAAAADSSVAQRGNRNLGLLFLNRAIEVSTPDSALFLLGASIGSNRAAIRLDPADESARWNLALAQAMLDSLMQSVAASATPSSDEGTRQQEGEGVVIPEMAQVRGRRAIEREAEAGDDPGSLNEAEARALLANVRTDVEGLIRAIMWSRRPDARPWLEPYPGGPW